LISSNVQVPITSQAEKPRAYASKKDWNKIDKDCGDELEAEKPEGDGAMNALFK